MQYNTIHQTNHNNTKKEKKCVGFMAQRLGSSSKILPSREHKNINLLGDRRPEGNEKVGVGTHGNETQNQKKQKQQREQK